MSTEEVTRAVHARSSGRWNRNTTSKFLPFVGETTGTISPVCCETQLLTTAAYVPAQSGRVSHNEGKIGHVTGNHRPSTNERISAYLNAAENGRVGSDACAFQHRSLESLREHLTSREEVVRKDAVRTEENTICDDDPLPQ